MWCKFRQNMRKIIVKKSKILYWNLREMREEILGKTTSRSVIQIIISDVRVASIIFDLT